jgi:peptidoglycan/LPS O-acetylase OafA/YrhL
MDGLAIGALIALAVRGPGGIAAVRPMAWLAVGITAPILGYLTLGRVLFIADEAVMMTIGYSLIAIFFGGALIIGITWAPLNYILSSSPLRWFGRYSYGIYVWHPIVNNIMFSAGLIALFRIDTLSKSAIYILCTIAVMLLVSLASYHFLERPFLKLKVHFEQGRGTGAAPATAGDSLQETARANSNASG